MGFELLLEAILGERKIFYVLECLVCGMEEIYYENSATRRLIGRACSTCHFVQKFDH